MAGSSFSIPKCEPFEVNLWQNSAAVNLLKVFSLLWFKSLTKAKCLLKNTFPITNDCSFSFCSASWIFLWRPGPLYLIQTCALPVRRCLSRACFSRCILATLLKFCSVYLTQLKVSSCFMSSALECSGRDSGPVATQIRDFCNKVPIWFC